MIDLKIKQNFIYIVSMKPVIPINVFLPLRVRFVNAK